MDDVYFPSSFILFLNALQPKCDLMSKGRGLSVTSTRDQAFLTSYLLNISRDVFNTFLDAVNSTEVTPTNASLATGKGKVAVGFEDFLLGG